MAVSLDEFLNEEGRGSVNRLLCSVLRGQVRIMNDILVIASKMFNLMTISPIIQRLAHLDRQAMIWQLQSELKAFKLTQKRLLVRPPADSEISLQIRKREGILAVIENGQKPSHHYLTDQDLQDLRPVMQHFIETGELDESTFRKIYEDI